jgi:hypothetical protein
MYYTVFVPQQGQPVYPHRILLPTGVMPGFQP